MIDFKKVGLKQGENIMHSVLVLIAILMAGIGFLFLSDATTGVGIIGLAALMGIFARLAQANKHHNELMEKMEELADQPQTVFVESEE